MKKKQSKKDARQDRKIAIQEKKIQSLEKRVRVRRPRPTPSQPRRSVEMQSSTKSTVSGRLSALHPIFTECGMDYFRVLTNPFGEFDTFPCIPTGGRGSQKLRVFKRGVFQVGSGGLGGVVVWPQNLAFNTESVFGPNAGNCIITTASTFANPTDFTFMNSSNHVPLTPPAGCQLALGNSIYSAVDLSADRSLRLVGAGLRVRYSGPAFQMNGDAITWRNPLPTTSLPVGSSTWDNLQQLQTATYEPVTSKWFVSTYAPYIDTDTNWLANYGNSNSSTVSNRLGMGVFVNGTPNDRYSYEVVAFFEVTGNKVPETISHASPTETQKAIAAVNGAIVPSASLASQVATAVGNIYKDTTLPSREVARGRKMLFLSAMSGTPPDPPTSVFTNPYLPNASSDNS